MSNTNRLEEYLEKYKNTKERDLLEICLSIKKGFVMRLLGNNYCSLACNRRVECPYLALSRDYNDLYRCNNPIYRDDTTN